MANPTTVDDHIARADPKRRDALTLLARLARETLIGFDESLAYGMPSYGLDGEVEVGFASRKRHVTLYLLRTGVIGAHRAELAGLSVGKGTIRFPPSWPIDPELVRRLLSTAAPADDEICGPIDAGMPSTKTD